MIFLNTGTVWAYKIKVERDELASICARSERFIGTQGKQCNDNIFNTITINGKIYCFYNYQD